MKKLVVLSILTFLTMPSPSQAGCRSWSVSGGRTVATTLYGGVNYDVWGRNVRIAIWDDNGYRIYAPIRPRWTGTFYIKASGGGGRVQVCSRY